MPGVFLLINLLVFLLWPCLDFVGDDITGTKTLFITNQAYSWAMIICFGYLIGVVLRLFRTQWVDDLSGWIIGLSSSKHRGKQYIRDRFFYGNWMETKCFERLPAGAAQFYEKLWRDKFADNPIGNTTFYNFCKSIIIARDEQSAKEVCAAEAMSRFIAGSMFALLIATLLAVLNILYDVLFLAHSRMMVVPIVAAIVYVVLITGILLHFRFIRCKEVDTMFAACFANCKAFEELLPYPSCKLSPPRLLEEEQYRDREALVRDAWSKSRGEPSAPAVRLDDLIGLMRERSETKPHLSCMYFAGADVDHPYFLKDEMLAIGLAVLPEDCEKAGQHKRHPHQVEVIFVLRGKVDLHLSEGNKAVDKVLEAGDYDVISKGVCHWITQHGADEAAYLFVKTNPAKEPRSQTC